MKLTGKWVNYNSIPILEPNDTFDLPDKGAMSVIIIGLSRIMAATPQH